MLMRYATSAGRRLKTARGQKGIVDIDNEG